MADKQKYTPIPWKIGESKTQNALAIFGDEAQDDGKIYRAVCLISPLSAVDDTDEANANFIIKACNAYPKLIELLEKLAYVSALTKDAKIASIYDARNLLTELQKQ